MAPATLAMFSESLAGHENGNQMNRLLSRNEKERSQIEHSSRKPADRNSDRPTNASNTIILVSGKLFQTDNVLPLLFELMEGGLISRPHLVCNWKGSYLALIDHPTISLAIEHLGGKLSYLSQVPIESSGLIRRLARIFVFARNLWILRSLLFRRIILLTSGDTRLTKMLMDFNRRRYGGIRLQLFLETRPPDAMKTINETLRFRRGVPDRRIIPDCDALISSYSRADFDEADIDVTMNDALPLIHVGYPRAMPSWNAFLENVSDSVMEREISSRCFVFFPLAVLTRVDNVELDFREVFKTILGVLKEFEDRFQVVFRYHMTTDQQFVREVIEEAGLQNFAFSNAHPLMLIQRALFTIVWTSATLAVDAKAMGCPVIEFTRHHPEYFRLTDGQSQQPSVVDYFIHDDKDELRRVVAELCQKGSDGPPARAPQKDTRFWCATSHELARDLAPLVTG